MKTALELTKIEATTKSEQNANFAANEEMVDQDTSDE